MKKLLLLLLFAGLLNTGSVFGWGREGHETIAKIAERNLTKKAKKRIEKYLGGHSIVYFAKWMDEYRHTPEYKFTNNWTGFANFYNLNNAAYAEYSGVFNNQDIYPMPGRRLIVGAEYSF